MATLTFNELRACYLEVKNHYREVLKRVNETPAPAEQKFPIGSFVRIEKDLGYAMQAWRGDTVARVNYTGLHAYGGVPETVKKYCLSVLDKDGSWPQVSWYEEHQLTLLNEEETNFYKPLYLEYIKQMES